VRALVVALIGLVAFGGGVMLGYKLDSDDKTAATAETALPAAVEQTRAPLLEAAESGDHEALRPLISDSFEYTFGSPVEGGPIAYWQRLETETASVRSKHSPRS
jgi:hypothetical protein